MNYKMIRYVLGVLCCCEGIFLLIPFLAGAVCREPQSLCFLLTAALCALCGGPLIHKKPANRSLYSRDGFVIVALSWIVMSIFGAVPLFLSGATHSFLDALFETVSGFTTTGATVIPNVEILPHCCILWRSFTHWIGGMGVLVFMMAVLPLAGGYNMNMMKAESPGPAVGKLVPHIRQTALILYLMYFGLTILQFFLLIIGGMNPFEAINTAMSTAGTGGFGFRNESIGSFSQYIQIVITVFMILFGVNFNIYYMILIRRKLRDALKSTELKVYLSVIFCSAVLITLNIRGMFPGIGTAFRHAIFTVSSIITTTGFVTADFDMWPVLSKTILVLLMFCGACAGSTGGGIKVSRVIILAKSVIKEMSVLAHPKSVKRIKFEGRPVTHDVMRSANVYIMSYLMIFILSLLVITLDGFDMVTNFTAVATTLNNVGPGLAMVGPTQNFTHFSALSKLVLSFDMLSGRLELFPILMLLTPGTWKK